jgi:signal transduction histidine kinase
VSAIPFRVAARAILELGAELISSDGIAIYELLKNGVDAGSSRIQISVNVTLRYSEYRGLLDAIALVIAERPALSPEARRESVERLRNRVYAALEADAPAACRLLCRQMLAHCTTHVSLRRSLQRFYDRANWITVSDTGEGMSLEDLSGVYLTIGTRSRQRRKSEGLTNPAGQAYLGEKGVGRLSAMRLGGLLRVDTTTSGEAQASRLDINWDHFSHDSDKLLSEIRMRPRKSAVKAEPSASGTTVKILRLRSDWDAEKVREIVNGEFSRLVDPFLPNKANRLLHLTYNGERHFIPEIEKKLFALAHAECRATFAYEDGRPVLRGYVNYRLRTQERTFVLGEPELRGAIRPLPFSSLMALGPFEMEFWWYNRAILTAVAGIGKKADVQKLVKRWSGGLMLYRDGYRINPYGGDEDDWLSLDKRAFSSKGFKLNRQQVIGRVIISSQNPRLVEQTNREGLTDTPEKAVLIALLQHVLFQEFKVALDKADREVRVQELTTLEDLVENVDRAKTDVARKIREIIVRVPQERPALLDLERLVDTLTGYIDQAKQLALEYETDRAKFVYLAGIGLMVEFILHELGRATKHTLETIREVEAEAPDGRMSARLPSSLTNLSDQLATIVKRVDTLDPLSTSRRQVKEDFDVGALVTQIVEAREAQAQRHAVSIEGNFRDVRGWEARGVPGMFIQIVENLLSNAFYWIGVQTDIEPGLRPRIEIDLDPDAGTVTVTDNGTGVEPSQAAEIFEAFVSHRPAREGKGLGLYISRELAGYHDWTIDLLPVETIRKGRFNSFQINLATNG